jgi:cytoskeletal protein RodZ
MPQSPTASTIGSLPDLSLIRASKGLELDDISRATKISTRYLEAIEHCDFQVLPGGVFNTSYLRQYARAIEYDEWDLLAFYSAVTSARQAELPPAPEPASWRCTRLAVPLLRWLALDKKN